MNDTIRINQAIQEIVKITGIPTIKAVGCDEAGGALWAVFETEPTAEQTAQVNSILLSVTGEIVAPTIDDRLTALEDAVLVMALGVSNV